MNRKILFKAKRIDNGEWEFGNYSEYEEPTEIPTQDGYIESSIKLTFINNELVDPNTVCQYVNREDKDKAKIFEGDYLGDWCEDDNGNEILGHYGVVTYYAEECRWILTDENGKWNDWTDEDEAKPENWGNLYLLDNKFDKEGQTK